MHGIARRSVFHTLEALRESSEGNVAQALACRRTLGRLLKAGLKPACKLKLAPHIAARFPHVGTVQANQHKMPNEREVFFSMR